MNGNGRALVERFFLDHYFTKEFQDEWDRRDDEKEHQEEIKQHLLEKAQMEFEKLNPSTSTFEEWCRRYWNPKFK